MALAFAAVASVFLVNILIVPVDGILVGITNDAIHLIDANKSIDLASNLWFSIASVLVMMVVVVLVNNRIVEPRLGKYTGDYVVEGENVLSADEYRGLKFAGVGLALALAFVAAAVAAVGRAAAQPGDRLDHRQLAIHEQPDRDDRAGLPLSRHRRTALAPRR